MKLLSATRIPFFPKGTLRVDPTYGCDMPESVCAVRRTIGKCWAEKLHKKMGYPGDFRVPVFRPEVLDAIKRLKKPRKIAMSFGGDIGAPGVKQEWRDAVWEVVETCPQHTFVFLTKDPDRACLGASDVPNLWLGVTATDGAELHERSLALYSRTLYPTQAHRWLIMEPLLGSIAGYEADLRGFEYVVIGGLTDGGGKFAPANMEAWESALWPASALCVPMFIKGIRQSTIRQLCAEEGAEYVKGDWRDIMPLGSR
jgi:protein gp37